MSTPETPIDELAEIERDIALAIDAIVDDEERRAAVILAKCNARLRLLISGPRRIEALRLWALSHCVSEEWEIALLKYEQILSIDGNDEDALWQSIQILLRQLEKPEPARTLLQERLLPLHRTDEYIDALREAEAALGITREQSATR
jgi:tetratricopeptide (TPR) repeat protein